jgi:hypothetical protein
VRNLIVDTRSGQVKYAVIASSGFIGVMSTLRLAPSQIMSAATTKRETLFINTTLARWKSAPVFKSAQMASLGEPGRAQEIGRYFGQPEARVASASAPSLSATGGAQPAALKFASDFIGRAVVNRQHQKIGEVLDLLVSFGQPHPAFAIISTGRFLQHGNHYAVPISALAPANGRRLMLNADISVLERAPAFSLQVWNVTSADNQQIYSYSKTPE